MSSLARDGVSVDLPEGWDGRIYRRDDTPVAPGLQAVEGERFPIVLQAGTFALPPDAGDYGGGAVELMGRSDVLVVLIEHGNDAAGTELFAAQGVPAGLAAADYDPNVLQRGLAGQSGAQRFFTAAGRAFGLYVVLGSHALRGLLAPEANKVISSIEIR